MPHTPGPWLYCPFGAGNLVTSDKGHIAVVYGAGVTADAAQNTCLIAAAPELLEAAEDVLEQYRKSIVPIGPDLSDSIRVFLAAAVRKAKRQA